MPRQIFVGRALTGRVIPRVALEGIFSAWARENADADFESKSARGGRRQAVAFRLYVDLCPRKGLLDRGGPSSVRWEPSQKDMWTGDDLLPGTQPQAHSSPGIGVVWEMPF